jgi:conjugal transfer/entry exclusion protein
MKAGRTNTENDTMRNQNTTSDWMTSSKTIARLLKRNEEILESNAALLRQADLDDVAYRATNRLLAEAVDKVRTLTDAATTAAARATRLQWDVSFGYAVASRYAQGLLDDCLSEPVLPFGRS